MRIPAIAALLVSLLALPGCIYVPPVWDIGDTINDVDWIKPGVTTKAQVVERLGEPDSSGGEAINYTGKSSHGFFAVGLCGRGGGCVGAGGLIEEKLWWVDIKFDKAGVVRSIDTSEPSETSEQPEVRVAVAVDQQLLAKAEQGDVEAQFQLSVQVEPPIEGLLCLSANGGHAPAQYYTGGSYENGRGRFPKDPVKAYQWYALASSNEHPTAKLAGDDLAKKMSPAQIAEAERLVAEWKPDLASCGELLVPATATDVAREDTGVQPACGAVGGYEAYMKRTGKVCRVAPIIHVIWGLDDQVYPQE